MAIAGDVPDIESGNIPSHLFALVYDELRRIAHRQRRGIGAPPTLNTTALVHEAYLKLSPTPEVAAITRAHFSRWPRGRCVRCWSTMRVAARPSSAAAKSRSRMMSRNCGPDRRGDRDARTRRRAQSADRARSSRGRVVEWHVFGGLSIEEIAQLQGVVVRTTYRDWRRARAFLIRHLDLPDPIVAG